MNSDKYILGVKHGACCDCKRHYGNAISIDIDMGYSHEKVSVRRKHSLIRMRIRESRLFIPPYLAKECVAAGKLIDRLTKIFLIFPELVDRIRHSTRYLPIGSPFHASSPHGWISGPAPFGPCFRGIGVNRDVFL